MTSARRLLLAAAILGLWGCGADETSPPPPRSPAPPDRLSAHERDLLRRYDSRIAVHCLRVSRSIVEPGAAPTPQQEQGAFATARRLLALASAKPRAPLGAGQDVRLFVSDLVENLEGSNCDPRMIGLLEEGLARIPAG